MLGSLTVALYLVSRCVEHIMGQVLARLAPDSWTADGAARPLGGGEDECGYRLHVQSRSVHHVALHDDEEMVIQESPSAPTANGVAAEPHAEAVLVEHAVLAPRVESAAVGDTGAARAGMKRSLPAAPGEPEENGAEMSAATVGEPEPKRRLADAFQTLIRSGHPFLDDPETVDYLRTSKVMFVMKGLPGSGKTHLARRIAETYRGAVMCSADDFFMKNGRYEFDREQLGAAHEACQLRAEQACHQQRAHIVIDNTNLRNWEWSVYSRLAAQHHYLLLLLEPDTVWRHDPARLAVTNSHQVTETELRKKLKSMQISIPLYYGWFLNAADCQLLMERVAKILHGAFRENKLFADDFCTITGSADITELSVLYPPPAELLHCTARFCGGRSRAAAARLYGDQPAVRRALGRLSTARVTGLLLTPRSLAVRLTLNDGQLAIWDQDDWAPTPVRPGAARPRRTGTGTWQVADCQPSLAVSGSKRPARTAAGRRAHITLGCRPGFPPVVAGNDLMAALDVLHARPETPRRPAGRLPGAALFQLPEQAWYVDFERDLVVDAVFGARY